MIDRRLIPTMRPLLCLLAIALAAALVGAGTASAVNPAGKKIAFVRGGNIWTIASDGTSPVDTGVAGSQPALNVAGTSIAFVTGGNVKTMNVDGTGVSAVLHTGTSPSWSPDGTSIAFADGGDIWTMTSAGASPTDSTKAGSSPSWAPSGTKIVYVNATGSGNVATMTGSGATWTTTDLGTSGLTPAPSPDGTKILYATTPPGGAATQLYLMNIDGSGQTRLVVNAFADSAPVWSPDGTKIAFLSNRETTVRLFLMNADGTGATSLSGSSGPDSTPSWGASLIATAAPAAPTGTAKDGQTLTAQNGTWAGTTPITYTYQWKRCNSGGTACTSITGATAQTFTATATDVGGTLRVNVTAANLDGGSSADSAASAVVTALAPTSLTIPTVTGSALIGQTLTGSSGTWRGTTPLTYAYQWQRCDSTGGSCADISGSTSATYVAAAADSGSTLRVNVVASNSAGSSTATASVVTAVVTTAVPTNTVAPAVTGTATVGQLLSATTGTWSGAAVITYAHQWRRCNSSGASCANITGATTSSYTVTTADAGSTLGVTVTATNSSGAATANSALTSAVSLVAPDSSVAPFVSGLAKVGSTLFATTGTWLGTTPLTYAYSWQRCDANGSSCAAITGATSTSYVVTAADVGLTLGVKVTATNSAGSQTASSSVTDAVVAATSAVTLNQGAGTAPTNIAVPAIAGNRVVGGSLTATNGTWTGAVPLTFAFQWQRCGATLLSCVSIASAKTAVYKVVAADLGQSLRVSVTASNTVGNATAVSLTAAIPATAATTAAPKTAAPTTAAPTTAAPKTAAPKTAAAKTAAAKAAAAKSAAPPTPSISGKAVNGSLLRATLAARKGVTASSYRYAWQRCNATGAVCVAIAKATAATYRVVGADVDLRLRVAVKLGKQTAVSRVTGIVTN